MKRRFVILLLCIVMLLSACTQPKADITTTTVPTTSPTEAAPIPREYDTIICNIVRAYPWNAEDRPLVPEHPELSYLYRRSMVLSDVGFAVTDLDRNGQAELLISNVRQDYVYDVYTLSNGQAVHLFASAERSLYYLRENGYVEHVWSGGAGLSGHDFYRLENGILSFVERIANDAHHALDLGMIDDISQANEVDTCFRSVSTQHADYQPISADVAENAVAAYQNSNGCLSIAYTPLTGYKDGAAEASNTHVLITQSANFIYSYEIIGHDGHVIERVDDLTREPREQYVSEDVVGVVIQPGTGLSTNYAVYYDLKTGAVSETFHYVLTAKKNYVVCVEHRDGECLLIVQDIFDKEVYYQEHRLENISPVAADCVTDGYFDVHGNVVITCLTGEDYQETPITIDVP